MPNSLRTKKLEANIWKYYIFRTFAKRIVFPIITIYLLRNDLTPTQIGILFSISTVVALVLEVPSGMIADKIGRKNSLLISIFGSAISMLLFWQGETFWVFVLADVVFFGLGSLMTGTHEAFLYETLKELGREKQIKKYVGRATFYSLIGMGGLYLILPILTEVSIRFPFFVGALIFFANLIVITTMTEPKQDVSVQEEELGGVLKHIGLFWKNQQLVIITIFFAAMEGMAGFMDDFRQVYFDFIHLDIAYFGILYLSLNTLMGLSSFFAEKIENKIGRSALLFLIPTIRIVAYFGVFFFNSFVGLVFVLLDSASNGFIRPIKQELINERASDHMRATYLSITNFLSGAIRVVMVTGGGFLISSIGIQPSFLVVTLLMVGVGIPLWYITQRATRTN